MPMRELLRKFARDAVAFGPRGLSAHVDELDDLIQDGRGPSRQQSEQLLEQLRGERCFTTMLEVAGDYAANEGIGIHAAARACREGR